MFCCKNLSCIQVVFSFLLTEQQQYRISKIAPSLVQLGGKENKIIITSICSRYKQLLHKMRLQYILAKVLPTNTKTLLCRERNIQAASINLNSVV